jgi:hypothetical protein
MVRNGPHRNLPVQAGIRLNVHMPRTWRIDRQARARQHGIAGSGPRRPHEQEHDGGGYKCRLRVKSHDVSSLCSRLEAPGVPRAKTLIIMIYLSENDAAAEMHGALRQNQASLVMAW